MILVTGGSGFLGSATARALTTDGMRVRCVGRASAPAMDIGGADYFSADLQRIRTSSRIFKSVSAIVHFASTTIPSTSMADMKFDAQSNIAAALRLLEAAKEHRIGTFIFASSGGTVYGNPTRLPAREGDPTEPLSSYGVVKLTIEHYVRLFSGMHGLRGVSLRIANPYGSGQLHGTPIGVIARLLQDIHDHRPFTVFGDGGVVRDFLHVDDVVRAIRLSLGDVRSGAYNIGSGRGHSLNEIIAVAGDVSGRVPIVLYQETRAIDVSKIYLDIAKFRSATGWAPTIALKDGVKRLWDELVTLRQAAGKSITTSTAASSPTAGASREQADIKV